MITINLTLTDIATDVFSETSLANKKQTNAPVFKKLNSHLASRKIETINFMSDTLNEIFDQELMKVQQLGVEQ